MKIYFTNGEIETLDSLKYVIRISDYGNWVNVFKKNSTTANTVLRCYPRETISYIVMTDD
jgi:hypothetical protein